MSCCRRCRLLRGVSRRHGELLGKLDFDWARNEAQSFLAQYTAAQGLDWVSEPARRKSPVCLVADKRQGPSKAAAALTGAFDLSEPALQKSSLCLVADERQGPSISRGRLGETSEAPKQVGAHRVEKVIAIEVPAIGGSLD